MSLAFEHQGEQHYRIVNPFTKTKAELKAIQKRDRRKVQFSVDAGVALIVIPAIPGMTRLKQLKAVIAEQCREHGVALPVNYDAIVVDIDDILYKAKPKYTGSEKEG